MTPVEQQEQAQKAQAAKQEAQIQKEQAAMMQQQQEMAAEDAKIAANKAAIAAVNKRFGELGDYNIWDEVTVLFGNDKVTLTRSTFLSCRRCARRRRRSPAT